MRPHQHNLLKPKVVPFFLAAVAVFACVSLVGAEPEPLSDKDSCVFTAPRPDWVRQIRPHSAEQREHNSHTQNVSYDLINTQVNLCTDTVQLYYESWIVPLSPDGLSDASEIQILYNPAFQKLFLHEMKIKRGRKIIDKLDAENITLMRREKDLEFQMYNGVMTATAPLSDVRVRDTVIYSYTLSGSNPVFDNLYSSTFSLGWGVYVGRTYVRINSSPAHKLHYKVLNSDASPEMKKHASSIEYIWDMKDCKPLIYEYGAPTWYNPYPHVQVSHFSSWKEVGKWARSLYDQQDSLTDDMNRTIDKWKQETDSKEHLLAKALDFTQQHIRYLGMELGINSHRPTPPASVLKRRFGDCKDKSFLLTAILKRCGIKAFPALVSRQSGKTIHSMLPSPDAFDHVIVMAQLNGEDIWMDPTEQYQNGPVNQRYLGDFGYGLLVKRGVKKLTAIQADRPSAQHIEEHYYVDSYDKPVRLEVTTMYRGSQAEAHRAIFNTQSVQEISNHNLNFYARLFASIEQQKRVSGIDDSSRNIFTTKEWYRIPQFWERKKGRLFCDLQGSIVNSYISLPGTIKRTMPLALPFPFNLRQKLVLHLPEDVPFALETADSAIVDNPAFRYTLAAFYADSSLTVTYEYTTKKPLVEPEEMSEFTAAVQEVNDQINYQSWIPYTDTIAEKKLLDSLYAQIDALTGGDAANSSEISFPMNSSHISPRMFKHALRLTHALQTGDIDFFNTHFDSSGFLNHVMEPPASPLLEAILSSGVPQQFNFGREVIGPAEDSSRCSFVGITRDNETIRYLFRRDFSNGTLTHFEIHAANADSLLFTDWYSYSIGMSFRTKAKQVFETAINVSPFMSVSTGGAEKESPIVELITNANNGAFSEAYDAFERIDAEKKRTPLIICFALLVGRQLGDHAYTDILRYIAREFGPESRYAYILLTYYLDRGDYTRAQKALDKMKDALGDDPALISYQALIDMKKEDYHQALLNARKAIHLDEDYSRPYWTLLEIFLHQKKHDQAIVVLDLLVIKFQHYVDASYMSSVREYKDFVRSRQFKQWQTTLH